MYRFVLAGVPPMTSVTAIAASDSSEKARAAIMASIERFRVAFEAGDINVIADTYTDDLVKLRHAAPKENKQEVVRRVADTFRDYTGHLEVAVDEIIVSGDFAFTRGTLSVTLTPRAGGPAKVVRRRSVELWRRDADVWRACRTIDNVEGE